MDWGWNDAQLATELQAYSARSKNDGSQTFVLPLLSVPYMPEHASSTHENTAKVARTIPEIANHVPFIYLSRSKCLRVGPGIDFLDRWCDPRRLIELPAARPIH